MRFLYRMLVIWLLFLGSSVTFAAVYQINPEQSYIHVLTTRSGALKGLSHKHVVELGPLNGSVLYLEEGQSHAQLQLLPQQFFVDRPQTTAQYPEIWKKAVNDTAARGTKKNMLSTKLLNAEVFPAIKVNITPGNTAQDAFKAIVTLKEKAFTFLIPGDLVFDGQLLTATAAFTLTHEQLGLKPFKAGGGLISVGDEMSFRVYILAEKISD